MNWFKKRTKTLYSKTLLGMFSISLLVLVTVAVTLSVWFRAEMVNGYHDLTKTAMRNTDVVFSSSMDNARDMLMEWYASPDGVGLRLGQDSDFTNHMAFINKTRSILNSTSYLQSACFINSERKMVLDVGTGVSTPENLEQLLVNKMLEVNGRNHPIVWKVKNRKSDKEMISLLSIPMAETAIKNADFNGMVVINIDLLGLNKTLFADSQEEQFRIYIINEEGFVVGNNTIEYLGEDWSQRAWVQRVLEGEEQFELKEEGKHWEYISFPTAEEGYYIVAQSDYVTQIVNINYIFYIIFAVIIVAAVIIIMLMLLVSRKIFGPFTKIIMNLKQSQIAEKLEPETDEVAFLEHFYHGVSSHIEVLNEKKEKDFIVKNLLLGNQKVETQLLLQNKKIITAENPYYMVLVLVENRDLTRKFSMQEYDMLRNMVSNVYTSVLTEYGKCTYFEVGLRRMLFIISAGSRELENQIMLEAIAEAEKTVCKLSNVKLFGLLSQRMVDGGEQCVPCFGRMNDCLKTRHLLDCQETIILDSEEFADFENLISQIANSLKRREKKEYMLALEAVLKGCEKMPYRQFVSRLEYVAGLIRKTGRISKNTENRKLEEASLKERIASLTGREEILLWLESIYDEAAIEISKVSNHSTANMIEEAVDYIRNNYDDCNLNVNLLADKLNISAAYFGKQFTEFTGCKTLEYILKVRMEKAKDLLIAEPDKDIAQIAEAVGYNNSTYFATAFRKYYGVTPSRFRDYNVMLRTDEDDKR